jgi:hypothetical protein
MTEEEKAVAEEPTQTQEIQLVEEPKVQETPVERNWKEAAEVMRLQKQRIEELEARINQTQKAPEKEADEFADLDPNNYLTVKEAKDMAAKLAEKAAAKAAKQVVQEYAQQQNVVNDEQRMRTKHEDFDYVIEHYAIPMIKNDAALAYKIQTSKNPAETAYKLAKLSDEYEASMTKQQMSPKAEKILKNSSKPVSSSSVGSPIKAQADEFSKMSPQQVWEMSQKFARGA